jgi:hypothetical protein
MVVSSPGKRRNFASYLPKVVQIKPLYLMCSAWNTYELHAKKKSFKGGCFIVIIARAGYGFLVGLARAGAEVLSTRPLSSINLKYRTNFYVGMGVSECWNSAMFSAQECPGEPGASWTCFRAPRSSQENLFPGLGRISLDHEEYLFYD